MLTWGCHDFLCRSEKLSVRKGYEVTNKGVPEAKKLQYYFIYDKACVQ